MSGGPAPSGGPKLKLQAIGVPGDRVLHLIVFGIARLSGCRRGSNLDPWVRARRPWELKPKEGSDSSLSFGPMQGLSGGVFRAEDRHQTFTG